MQIVTKNDPLAFFAPDITKEYGLELLGILYPSSQCCKSHTDAHFSSVYGRSKSTSKSKILTFISSCLHRFGLPRCISNSMVELYIIGLESDGIRSVMNVVKEKRNCLLELLSEISYEVRGEDIYDKFYEHYGEKFIQYNITPDYSCRRKSPPKSGRRLRWKGWVVTNNVHEFGGGFDNAFNFQRTNRTVMESDSTNERIGESE